MPTRPAVHRPSPSAVRRHRRHDTRPSAYQRGYDDAWEVVRLAHLREHPLCQDCLQRGLTTSGEDVHHLAKVSERPDLIHDPANLRTLCRPCHNRRTRMGE